MDEMTNPTPEGAAPAPVETPAVARAPDGKFTSPTPPAPEPSATPDAEAHAEAPAEAKTEPEKPKNRASERINQLTAEKHAAIREAAALRQRLEALQQAPKPQIDPNDYDAIQREGVRGVIREETAQQTAVQYDAAVKKAQEATVQTFYAKVEAVRDRIPNIDESIQAFSRLPLSNDACEIIAESDVAAELAHHIALNPRIAYEMQGLSPAQQGRALARIESQLSIPNRRTSAAPPPPPSVTGSAVARQKTPQEESASEYLARRQKEWAAQRGR
jgi:hypothetical protein